MEIESIRHKVLRVFVKAGRARGIDTRLAGRLRNMMAFLVAISDVNELKTPPNFGFHLLKGDRAGTCAMTVTKNWRLTFRVTEIQTIIDLDLEDYH